jgi:hypothetical protein
MCLISLAKKINCRNLDAGFYKCEITQQCRDGSFQTISTGSSKMTLENCAPFVVTEPQDLCTDPGNVIELSCLIEGNPIPRFQWYKNDYPISNEVTTILKVTHFFLVMCVMHFVKPKLIF